jgi:alpha-tubulin suppressor-like RCC1 family protein
MLSISESDIFFDEDNLDKLGLNCYSIAPTSEITKFNSSSIKDGFKSTPKKDKAAIFSPFLYDYLMHKISYKNNPPNSIVLSWGNNNHNETSHNNYDYLSLPRLCYKLKDEEVSKISCGWEHNIVITNNKKCFSWGNNQSGQCGIVDAPLVYNPSLIEQLDNVIEVSCGNEHSLALNNLGEVFSWGKSEDGVLGYIENNIEYIPKKIKSLEDVVSIVSGSIHNMVLMKDGTVKSWGCSKGGQLGHSEDYLMSIDNFTGYLSNPTDIESLKLAKIKKVSCGEVN